MCDVCRSREARPCETCGAPTGARCVDRWGRRKRGCGHARRGSGTGSTLPATLPGARPAPVNASWVASLRKVNVDRAREVARRDAEIAAEALRLGPLDWPPAWLAVAQARQELPSASWREVGASIGITKDAAVGIFRRLREHLAAM